ncbi:MAG: hypothetical protein QMD22_09095 [archaeon]|nr:hypothetical protein [archaeon]
MASVTLPPKLREKLGEKAEEKDYLLEELAIEILFHVANGLHKNFYENEMTLETVTISVEDIERLIEKLRSFS